MKKFFLLLAAALPLVFTSCGDDKDDDVVPTINLNVTEVTMNYGGEYKDLKCYDANGKEIKKVTWTVDDEFVATVNSNGELKANHVGETKVKAIYENATKTAKVVVKATNNDFTMPLLTFGASMQDVRDGMDKSPFLGNVEKTEDFNVENSLSYSTKGTIYPMYGYDFTNDRLVSSWLICEEGTDVAPDYKLTTFLGQYYKSYTPADANEEIIYLCNANDVADATVLVEIGIDEKSNDDYVIWVPAVGSKTRAAGSFQAADFERAREIISAQIKAVK